MELVSRGGWLVAIGSNKGEAEEERAASGSGVGRGGGTEMFDEGFWKLGLGRGSIGTVEGGTQF